jgi:competence protein ComEC
VTVRAPAAAVTVPFIGGIVAGSRPPSITALCLAAAFLSLAVLACRYRRRLGATVLLLVGFFFLGMVSRQLAAQSVERQPLARHYESLGRARFGRAYLLTGVLREEPLATSETVRMWMGVETWSVAGVARPFTGELRVNVRGDPEWRRSLTELRAGDRISLWAMLGRPRGYLNPGRFDVGAYLARAGVTLSGTVKSPLLIERLSSSGWWSPARLGSNVRSFVRRRMLDAFHDRRGEEVAGVAIALLIGDRTFIPAWAELLYQESGIFHVVVISGAHVALLAALIYGTLRWLGLDRDPALLALLATLPLYAGLCGARPSVVRAVTMCLCVVGARLLSLDAPAVNGLACSALMLLAVRPLDLDDPGFQLSFAATAAILVLAGPLARGLSRDDRRPTYLAHAFAISLVAQAAVIPLIAAHFQRLTLGAVPASIVAMPLAAGSLVASAILTVLAPVPGLGAIVTWIAWFFVSALTACARFAVSLPGASIRVPEPGGTWLVLYVALLVTASISRGRLRLGTAVLLCAATLWLPFQTAPASPDTLRLTAFDVGHGDCLLLELPDGRRILVDAGGSFDRSFDVGENVVVPALLHRGVRRLAAAVVTHADFDHLGGLAAVVSNLDVGEIWEGRPAWELADYRRLRETAKLHDVLIRRLRAGEVMELGDVRVEVLAAGISDDDQPHSRNDDSLVLRICYGGSCMLLTGDAEKALELQLIRSGWSLRADVLKVAHHGSRSSTSAAFLEAVRPRVAIVSTGSGNAYLPSTRVMVRLRRRGVTSLRTDLDGAVTIELDSRGAIRMETFINQSH